MAERYLIVNADDFGQSPGVNRGIIRAHQEGILTSASLMVRWPAAGEAAAYARSRPAFSVGLHVDLGEWAYRQGAWVPVYEVVPLDDLSKVATEVTRQLETFCRLLGRTPTHLDSHQHVHCSEPVSSVLVGLGRALGVPVRHCSPLVRYCGDFYGQDGVGVPYPEGISVGRLVSILRGLPPGQTELACHPGDGSDMDSMYRSERAREVEVLCDPQVRATLVAEGIALRSFHGLARLGRETAEGAASLSKGE
jgi:predicted glycoside hydrolase/deacetylase ChbG (UPF0249 family)